MLNLFHILGLVYKGTDIIAREGQYCIDLVSDDFTMEVEIERNTDKSPLFSFKRGEFSLIVSKFEKYFRAADNKKRYMVFVLDNGEKISIISGNDIRKLYYEGVYCRWYDSVHKAYNNKIHAYDMSIQIAATFDTKTLQPLFVGNRCSWIQQSFKSLLKSAEVFYDPMTELDEIPIEN